MKRVVWIPVAGTLAAVLAVALAHETPEEEPGTSREPELEAPREDDGHDEEHERHEHDEEAEEADEPREVPEAPPPKPEEYTVRVEADGRLHVRELRRDFEDVEALLEAIAPPDRPAPRVTVTNASADVPEAALRQVVLGLGERAEVRTYYYHGASDGD